MREEGSEYRCCLEAQDVGGRQQAHASGRQAGHAQGWTTAGPPPEPGGTWRPGPASQVRCALRLEDGEVGLGGSCLPAFSRSALRSCCMRALWHGAPAAALVEVPGCQERWLTAPMSREHPCEGSRVSRHWRDEKAAGPGKGRKRRNSQSQGPGGGGGESVPGGLKRALGQWEEPGPARARGERAPWLALVAETEYRRATRDISFPAVLEARGLP